MSELPGKPTSAARITVSQIMDLHDTNLLGTVHGGVIMKRVEVGVQVRRQHRLAKRRAIADSRAAGQ